MSGHVASTSRRASILTLRFRAEIIVGFATVLAISAVSMAFAYVGFERVSAGVASYRASVSETDFARNVDRELLAYGAAARYFVVTGKEDNAQAALEAEARLKNGIDEAIKSVTKSARLERFNKLASDFSNFGATFAKILQAKRDSALIVKNQLQRNADLFAYKLGDIGRDASDAEAKAIEFNTSQVNGQF